MADKKIYDGLYVKDGRSAMVKLVVDGLNSHELNDGHDGRYYTEVEIDLFLAGLAPLVHDHDLLYYTQSQIDILLQGLQDQIDDHRHDTLYGPDKVIEALTTQNTGDVKAGRFYERGGSRYQKDTIGDDQSQFYGGDDQEQAWVAILTGDNRRLWGLIDQNGAGAFHVTGIVVKPGNGVLTGITGDPGDVTVQGDNGKIWIENRTGIGLKISVDFVASLD